MDDHIETRAVALLGRLDLKQAQAAPRAAMIRQALAQTRGSRRAAAHLLRVDRVYVQRLASHLRTG